MHMDMDNVRTCMLMYTHAYVTYVGMSWHVTCALSCRMSHVCTCMYVCWIDRCVAWGMCMRMYGCLCVCMMSMATKHVSHGSERCAHLSCHMSRHMSQVVSPSHPHVVRCCHHHTHTHTHTHMSLHIIASIATCRCAYVA